MSNRSVRPIWRDATNLNDEPQPKPCVWRDCAMPKFLDTPLCAGHAGHVYSRVREFFDAMATADDRPAFEPSRPVPFVYYLMLRPGVVKIGTTIHLRDRVTSLQSDIQYVVGLEIGGTELERERHQQFSADRLSRSREHFTISGRLAAHIASLQGTRDELVAYALTRPRGEPSERTA